MDGSFLFLKTRMLIWIIKILRFWMIKFSRRAFTREHGNLINRLIIEPCRLPSAMINLCQVWLHAIFLGHTVYIGGCGSKGCGWCGRPLIHGISTNYWEAVVAAVSMIPPPYVRPLFVSISASLTLNDGMVFIFLWPFGRFESSISFCCFALFMDNLSLLR